MSKTVFVLGAGASREANLPVGDELKVNIATLLDLDVQFGSDVKSGDLAIFEAIRSTAVGKNYGHLIVAARAISDAMPLAPSIDNFLDSHRDDPNITLAGKLGIVRAILMAEKESLIWDDWRHRSRDFDFRRLNGTWFNRLWQVLFENCRLSDVEFRLRSVAFIVFNYDRCIEQFLYTGLQTYFPNKITADRARDLVNATEIYHPYGVVGSLPWQGRQHAVTFGDVDTTGAPLLRLASQIKTFTEGTDESSSDIKRIRLLMCTAQRFVFLGFRFHRLNMTLLWPEKSPRRRGDDSSILGTAIGISESDVDIITEELEQLSGIPGRIELNRGCSCSQLFGAYQRTLQAVSRSTEIEASAAALAMTEHPATVQGVRAKDADGSVEDGHG
jgi:hypothetical protein